MRDLIKEFVTICEETLHLPAPIIEFGSLQVPGQEGYADMRPIFRGKEYIGADMRPGLGVDKILDLHKINLPDSSVKTILLLDTLEHVEHLEKAIQECKRILTKDGVIIMSSVMNFPIHDYPYDYWRFTPEAFSSMLSNFKKAFVTQAGAKDFPHTIVGIGFKGNFSKLQLNTLIRKLKLWQTKWREQDHNFLRNLMLDLTPPIIVKTYRRLKYHND